ncbi:C40 family peptidase [Saccharibacillus qingshengii]|uniref:C40 family peptidase n=1 Tax=Saccharibacillus qingshengii TaxID=1763540 RepID=UPI0015575221|nr:C40 family peptidase [Saccharibacillus qingshengii]
MKRKFFSLLAASALLVTVPVAAEASSGKVDRPVNLRSAPSASEGSVYRTLQPGTKLEVLSELNTSWLKVEVSGKTGYVSSSYITYSKASAAAAVKPAASASTVKPASSPVKTPAPPVKQASLPAPAAGSVKTSAETVVPAEVPAAAGSGVVVKNVNFRAEPVTGSDVYRVLSAGETFAAVELANSAWLRITDTSGVTGYVSTSYVTYTLPGLGTVSPAPSVQAPPAPAPAVEMPVALPLPVLPSSDILPGGTVASGSADRVIQDALALQGITHYGFGRNEAPVLFDCSSFTRYVFGLQGVNLPFGTAYQKDIGIPVEKDQWQKGDLLFFWSSIPGLIGHVGIYDGEGHLVHNSASKDGVAIADLDLKYWQDHYVSARRVLQ